MSATIRALKPAAEIDRGAATHALAEHRDRVAGLNARADDVRRRIEGLTALLRDADTARDSVASLRAARQAAAGRLIAEGRPADLRDHDAQIKAAEARATAAEQRLAQTGAREAVEAAVAHLCEQQRQHQAEAAVLAAAEPRLLHGVALERLAATAPEFERTLVSFVAAMVETAAVASVCDQLGPRAGGPQVASGFARRIEIATPAHPAFERLTGVSDYGSRIAARAAELLRELDAPVR